MRHLIIFTVLLQFVSFNTYSKKRSERPVAQAYVVMTLDGKVLKSRNGDSVRSIASLSKMMATLVILDEGLLLNKKTMMTDYDWKVAKGGCRTRLKRNKSYTNRDLLHAAILGSDNRAIPALGRSVGLNAQVLTSKMNSKAKNMGLKHTIFKDPTGINPGNVSTAKEIVQILKAAYNNKVLSKIMSTPSYTVKVKGLRSIIYNNTNILTRYRKYGIGAGKTGFNSKAGYCLATIVKEKNKNPIAYVILGSTGLYRRFTDFYIIRRNVRSSLKVVKNSASISKNNVIIQRVKRSKNKNAKLKRTRTAGKKSLKTVKKRKRTAFRSRKTKPSRTASKKY
ncbi:MAG: D-alanyl-D-alanine carboxypeptidase [Deltaproteobacteria bacterium]|nr:D-alanyl-D-alanine carboxypeptidase [Deltaproteobacteria bacterium]